MLEIGRKPDGSVTANNVVVADRREAPTKLGIVKGSVAIA